MTTNIYTLREYADLLDELAEEWDEDPPAVVIGDLTGNLNVSKKDGYVQHGNVGYATEAFSGDPVWLLGQETDARFYGTMLVPVDDLSEEGQEALRERADREEVEA